MIIALLKERKNWGQKELGQKELGSEYNFFVNPVRENVRAHLRVIVKRILRKHGYPPDKQGRPPRPSLSRRNFSPSTGPPRSLRAVVIP